METLEVLQKCTVEGMVVKLPNVNLERKEYTDVKKSLEKIGGKWKGGKVAGFVFASDPTKLLGEIAGGKKINLKKDFQYFATTTELSDKVVSLACLNEFDTICEPSVGQGAIVRAINDVCSVIPDCYELMETNRVILNQTSLKFNLIGEDFLSHGNKKYSKIIANPPFTKNQDIIHFTEMYNILEDNGRLVCITSESWANGSQKKQVAFREWLTELNAEIIDIERGAFKSSGTNVGGKIIVVDKKP
jgi:hypothetical protein